MLHDATQDHKVLHHHPLQPLLFSFLGYCKSPATYTKQTGASASLPGYMDNADIFITVSHCQIPSSESLNM